MGWVGARPKSLAWETNCRRAPNSPPPGWCSAKPDGEWRCLPLGRAADEAPYILGGKTPSRYLSTLGLGDPSPSHMTGQSLDARRQSSKRRRAYLKDEDGSWILAARHGYGRRSGAASSLTFALPVPLQASSASGDGRA
jgi:hypothetical protein